MTLAELGRDSPFVGDSEMAQLMRAFDWSSTPLGPAEGWPQSLRSAVSILLSSKAEIVLFWGPELVALYNDAYAPTFASKHPWALGKPARECWSEVWDVLGPLFEHVLDAGESFAAKDYPFLLMRNGYLEETYYDVSYDPVRAEGGGIGGVFCIVAETTGQVIGERRLRLLHRLSDATAGAHSVEDVCAVAAGVLSDDAPDIPFSLIYLAEGANADQLTLAAGAGVGPVDEVRDLLLDPGVDDSSELCDAIASGRLERIGSLPCSLVSRVPLASDELPREAVALPLGMPGRPGDVRGVLVCGVSVRRALDDDYRRFFTLIATQITNAIANARAYEAERVRAEALADLDRAKTAFFSNVSHEFRTPLTLMMGPLEDVLGSVAVSEPDARASLLTAHRNSLRLLRLVNTLLDFSRIETGRIEADYRRVQIGELTHDLASMFRSAVERAGLAFVIDCPNPSGEVYVDVEMWEKIVLNLLSNALKFTFSGEIAVRLDEADEDVILIVSDTGTGIAEDELPRLFERFHRIRNARSRTHEGSGIGLAFVRELARLHGGEVTVESTYGAGATFRVRIPKGRDHLPDARISEEPASTVELEQMTPFVEEAMRWLAPPEETATREPGSDRGVERYSTGTSPSTVLVADDNADMRAYLGRLLSAHWNVTTVADGAAALDVALHEQVDLVLSDVMMPGLDGYELLARLRADEQTASLPVILLSARAGEESKVEGLDAGADDYLVKPFAAAELIARVRSHLELSALRQSREAAIEEIERERSHFYALLMQAPVAIAVIRGHDLVFELANALALEIYRRPQDEVLERPLLAALPELAGQGFDEIIRNVMRTGEPFMAEEVPIRIGPNPSEEPDYINLAYVPMVDPFGHSDRVMACGTLVTEQVRARLAMEAANQALQEANEVKDEFLGLVSHELKTPLTTIRGNAEILSRYELDDQVRSAVVGDIAESGERLNRIVENLLLIARAEHGEGLAEEPLIVARVVARVVQRHRRLLPSRQFQVVEHGERLPVIFSDAGLDQVIENLVSNAEKYSPAGEPITIELERDESEVRVRVLDRGSGISDSDRRRIFEPFFRSKNIRGTAPGLGIGLAVCKRLVEAQDGRMWVNPRPGGGAEVGFALPVRLEDDFGDA